MVPVSLPAKHSGTRFHLLYFAKLAVRVELFQPRCDFKPILNTIHVTVPPERFLIANAANPLVLVAGVPDHFPGMAVYQPGDAAAA